MSKKKGEKRKKQKPQANNEIRKAITDAALAGADIVSSRIKMIQETSIGVVERGILDDVAQHALNIGQAQLPGIMANCRFSIMAAWQLGYSGNKPDFLPGEAVPVLLRGVKDIPQEDQERNIQIAASLAATAVSQTLTQLGRMNSARVHCWVAFLYGKDRRMMEAGAS